MPAKKPSRQAKVSQTLSPADFVHLHNHSHHSLLDGLTKIPEMLDRVVELGMTAVALTDHGTMSGAIDFYEGCLERDLKPIIGLEAYLTPPDRRHTDRDPARDKTRSHLILLAASQQGYANLMRLCSLAGLDGFYHKPRLDRQLLAEYQEGIIVLSGCMGGELGRHLERGDLAAATATAQWFKQTFGDRYYLEVQDHKNPTQVQINEQILGLGKQLAIPVVVTGDAHYLTPADKDAHEVLLSIQTGSYRDDAGRMTLADYDLHLTDPREIIDRWADHPEVVANTRAIADRCRVALEFDQNLMPHFELPPGETLKGYFQKLVFRGLVDRYGQIDDDTSSLTVAACRRQLPAEVIDRASYELETINRMGLSSYFLIFWDLCHFGREQGIFFGPARGSAAGSILAYALRITDIDPLKYGLLFERFLNPDRIAMPDIDIDIEDHRREEIIDYVVDKYGGDRKVANIVTFGKMAARNSLRDVARVLQVPYNEADRLAKMILPTAGSLQEALAENPGLLAESQKPERQELFELARKLEGTIRSHGVHAAGIVIAPAGHDLIDFTPLELSPKGSVVTQYSMYKVEKIGLLKMDFLGISNLTTIKNARRIIRKVYGQEIDLSRLDLEDRATYKMLASGDTTGVFQLDKSAGMRDYLQKLQVREFEDIVVLIALYRPGPLKAGFVDKFVKRRAGREEVDYPHPAFEPALKSTYGLAVYQEQVMQISRDVCGFTGGQPDTLRKAIGKKLRAVLDTLKDKFIDGGVAHSGVPREVMERFWQDLLGFADYAFNRSHSVAYATIAYQTAYLKANWRPAFMAALMTTEGGDSDRLRHKIDEAQRWGIKVLPPDINLSHHEFALIRTPAKDGQPEHNEIRFGLDAVKTVGSGAVEAILVERQARGEFASFQDFVDRARGERLLNRKNLESLIKVGAFDFDSQFGRQDLLDRLDSQFHSGQSVNPNQVGLFDAAESAPSPPTKPQSAASVSRRQQLDWERELLGVYLSGHPLADYPKPAGMVSIADLRGRTDSEGDPETVVPAGPVKIVGLISDFRVAWTKSREQMAFINLEDDSGEIEFPLFPRLYQLHRDGLAKGRPARVALAPGRSGIRSDWQIESLEWLDEAPPPPPAPPRPPGRLWLKLRSADSDVVLDQIKQILRDHPGQSQPILVIDNGRGREIKPLSQIMTDSTDSLIDQLQALEAVEQVEFTASS